MSKDMIRAADLRVTVNSQGWRVVDDIIETIVREAETAALDCDDESQIIPLQRDARVARKFADKLRRRVNGHAEPTDNDFSPIAY